MGVFPHQLRAILTVTACGLLSGVGVAETLVLKDGRQVRGRVGAVTSMAEDFNNPPGEEVARGILFAHDDLRRVFVPKTQVDEVKNTADAAVEVIQIKQPVATAGSRISSVGPFIKVTPWDAFGRRTVTMAAGTKDGKLDVIQGITQLTPHWARVEALRRTGGPLIIWDMRIAASSIPRETLSRILVNYIDRKNVNERLKMVRLYVAAERYQDAEGELAAILKDFPDLKNLRGEAIAIRQLGARRLVQELEMRQAAGQHQLVQALLKQFPTQDVAGAILEQVKSMQQQYEERFGQIANARKKIDELVAESKEPTVVKRLAPALDEIKRELNLATLDRLTEFRNLADAANLSVEQKLAVAVTGWLFGRDAASQETTLAASAWAVRDSVRAYMQEENEVKRQEIVALMQSEEAAAPRHVARIVAHMKPPLPLPAGEIGAAGKPDRGFYALTAPTLQGERDVTYYVQLPPEYDPYQRYPAIVTLNGTSSSAEQQVDWWAGETTERGTRIGQAGRRGYIVISVDWMRKAQTAYQYSGREHAAVLNSLRDACRRFAIDTDRVFLSGHSIGGDAAWDIGLAHPDLWAGVIPITSVADKYVAQYWPNGRTVPFCFVGGELDGDKLAKNAKELDRYMTRSGFNFTVVEYLGRGHEHFFEEIQHLFDWMGRHQRDFFPKKFSGVSMRPWDNFFWWVEVDEIPETSLVHPSEWPSKNKRAMTTQGSIAGGGGGVQAVNVQTGAARVVVWLAPEMVDFARPVRVTIKGRTLPGPSPDVATLLEDVRTRGDRQHPFWARLEVKAGRGK
jgi:predicted esterase